MALQSLQDLYMDELKDVYSMEHQIIKALPKMVKAASTPELQNAFEHHLQQTQGQVQRLERIFGELGKTPAEKSVLASRGFSKRGVS